MKQNGTFLIWDGELLIAEFKGKEIEYKLYGNKINIERETIKKAD